MFQSNVELLQGAHIGLGLLQQGREAFDRIDLFGQLRQDRCLIAAAGTDFQRFAEGGTPVEQQFDHARNDIGLRNGLPHAQRQGGIFISARGECLFDEDMPGNSCHRLEDGFTAYPFFAEALDHARPRALRGHANTV